jgi:twitching motility protein PilJ
VIRGFTGDTATGANRTARSVGKLAELASELRRSVADFKLPGAGLADALDDDEGSGTPATSDYRVG